MSRGCPDNLVKPQDISYNCRKAAMASAIPQGNAHGVVLLITLILLVMLSVIGYTLTTRVASQRHRCQYIIDYQNACYACQSGLKYAFAALKDVNELPLISRPNEPDFSDLFAMSEQEYKKLLSDWARQSTLEAKKTLAAAKSPSEQGNFKNIIDVNDVNAVSEADDISYIEAANDANDVNVAADIDDVNNAAQVTDFNDPNSLTVRGPYGPAWPFVIEPVEFEIGPSRVRVEMEDENAKYPVTWALLDTNDLQPAAMAGLELFCEWMKFDHDQIKELESQLKQIGKIKTFNPNIGTITVSDQKTTEGTTSGRIGRRSRRTRKETVQVTIPPSAQLADFAKLFHSSLIDTESLARPTIVSETRKESALKYMGVWASDKINVNTAPRHVLEAAFAFGGDEVEIAQKIIERRRETPFENTDDLRKTLFKYSVSVDKCAKYITTSSDFFIIKVTALSGTARASAVVAVRKNGKKLEQMAVIAG
jgi:hypothetical protein